MFQLLKQGLGARNGAEAGAVVRAGAEAEAPAILAQLETEPSFQLCWSQR